MFALAVRYLTGRAVATQVTKREAAEWPPHPGRMFMALVAAWGLRGRNGREKNALAWLETLPPPALRASGFGKAEGNGQFLRPGQRWKKATRCAAQGRTPFPSVVPDEDTVYFIWYAEIPVEASGGAGRTLPKCHLPRPFFDAGPRPGFRTRRRSPPSFPSTATHR